MIVDNTLSPIQNVINLINETNGTTFTADDFEFSDLTQTDFTEDQTVKNSSLTVECTLNNEFYGSQQLAYRRLYLQGIIKSDHYSLQQTDTLTSIKALIADRYKLIADELEWADNPVLDLDTGESADFVLQAVDGSYVYLGQVTITITNKQAAVVV